jgi:ribosomal protein S18 acetylase RimI-like enzyme
LEKVIYSSFLSSIKDSQILNNIQELDQKYFNYPWKSAHWREAFNNPKLSIHCLYLSAQPSAQSKAQSKAQSTDELREILSGFCLFEISQLENLAHLYKVLILPEFRNKGNASSLFVEAITYMKKQGLEKVYLEVSVMNLAAIGFYEKHGFVVLNRIKNFYSNGEDAFAMQKMI